MRKFASMQGFCAAFSFSLLLFIASCSKENSKPNTTTTTPPPSTVVSPYYVEGLLGGQPISLSGTPTYYAIDTVSDSINCHSHGHDQDDDNWGLVSVVGASWYIPTTTTPTIGGSIELRKLSVRIYVAPVDTSRSNLHFGMVQQNTFNYATVANPSNGVYVSIRDNSGTLWNSLGDQSGSTFQITSVGSNQGTYTTISGILSANVYDANGNKQVFKSVAFKAVVGL